MFFDYSSIFKLPIKCFIFYIIVENLVQQCTNNCIKKKTAV